MIRGMRLTLALALALAMPSTSFADSERSTLPILIRCEACDASTRPAVSLAWMGKDGPSMSSIQAIDWDAGTFVGAMGDGSTTFEVPATSIDASTWQLDVELPVEDGHPLAPFRAVITLPSHSATRAVAFPSLEPGPVSFELTPVSQVLDDHPTWDPKRSLECEVLIPKTSSAPVTFYSGGTPRAWLYPAPGLDPAAENAWIFQFAKPGASLLERLSVFVTAFDEGDALAFRLPLQAVSSAPLAGDAPKAVMPRTMRVGESLSLALDDCPRETR